MTKYQFAILAWEGATGADESAAVATQLATLPALVTSTVIVGPKCVVARLKKGAQKQTTIEAIFVAAQAVLGGASALMVAFAPTGAVPKATPAGLASSLRKVAI